MAWLMASEIVLLALSRHSSTSTDPGIGGKPSLGVKVLKMNKLLKPNIPTWLERIKWLVLGVAGLLAGGVYPWHR
jgi:hypothetical protein